MIVLSLVGAFAADDSFVTESEPFIPVPSRICSPVGRPSGPLNISLLPGRLGALRDPCLRSQAGIAMGGSLLVDTADFYGRLQLAGSLDARVRVSKKVEVFTRIEGFRGDNVIAPISVSSSGLGAMAIGVNVQLERPSGIIEPHDRVLSVHSQLILPTAPFENAAPLGLDVGISAARSMPHGDLHGGATLFGQTMLGPGPGAERIGLSGQVGITRALSEHGLAVVLDMPLSIGWSGGLDYLGLAGALRFGTGKPPTDLDGTVGSGLYGEFGIFAPLVGKERTLIAGEFRLGYRWK